MFVLRYTSSIRSWFARNSWARQKAVWFVPRYYYLGIPVRRERPFWDVGAPEVICPRNLLRSNLYTHKSTAMAYSPHTGMPWPCSFGGKHFGGKFHPKAISPHIQLRTTATGGSTALDRLGARRHAPMHCHAVQCIYTIPTLN